MASRLIQADRRLINELSTTEQTFVMELLADDLWNPEQAAAKAGYKHPGVNANRLLKKPAIRELLGREQRRRLERLRFSADEVLNMLAQGLFFNPLTLFRPTASGSWAIEAGNLDKVPPEIGRMVTEVKTKTVDKLDESGNVCSTTYFEIKFLDKNRLLELAMKHCGIEGTTKVNVQGKVDVSLNLAGLLQQVEESRAANVIDSSAIERRLSSPENIVGNAS